MAAGTSPLTARGESHEFGAIQAQRRFHPPAIPAPRTSFVGRSREIETVQQLLQRDDVAIVTLTGPGGVGKTRLSIQLLGGIRSRTTWFVDLCEVQQAELVLPSIATVLGLQATGRPVLESITTALQHDDHLLVLDNFEQVQQAAPLIGDLLRACPRLKLLVTSRTVLGVAGEHVVDIRPLPVPSLDRPGTAHGVGDIDACRLFIDRARALDPGFAPSAANRDAIISICRELDGLPLAIELAAAWIPVLAPGELLALLEDRLNVLSSGGAGAAKRHHTMRDAIAWSYGLLDESTQTIFRRLSVFPGGFSLEGLRAVCAEPSIDPLHELRVLVANSLVRRTDETGLISRYVVLETVRAFGLECLAASGEAQSIEDRFSAYQRSLARQALEHQNTPERDLWLDRLELEQGNLHHALHLAIARNDAAYALELAGSLLPFWQYRFHSSVGLELARRALALDSAADPTLLLGALFCVGTLSYMSGSVDEAEPVLLEALAYAGQVGDHSATGRIELALGRIAWDRNESVAARYWFDAARERFDRTGDVPGHAWSLHYLGLVAFTDGDNDTAGTLLRDAGAIWQELGLDWELACCIPGHLADLARTTGHLDDALHFYQECLSQNWERQDLENVAWSLVGLAIINASDDRLEEAAHLLALADRFRALTGAPLTPHIERDHQQATESIVSKIGLARFDAIVTTVRSTAPEIGVADAIALTRHQPAPAVFRAPLSGLTHRELEVLRLVATGKSNREIAAELFISIGTVKVHVTHVLAKLDLASRSAATDFAHRNNLV